MPNKPCHYTDIPGEAFGPEAPGVTIRSLINEESDNAPVYALRMIEVAPGGHTPNHNHPYEHENFVVEGHGRMLIDDTYHPVKTGDVIFVPPGVQHTSENTSDIPFKFLCGIPVSKLLPKS